MQQVFLKTQGRMQEQFKAKLSHLKIMKTLLIFLVFILSFQSTVLCQTDSNPPRNLKPGDNVPDIEIPKIINDEKGNTRISDYKDQLLILDFWTTLCSSCIEALPKIDALNREFAGSVRILPVTNQDSTLIANFFKRNKLVKNLNISSVVNDRVLSSWFKHKTIPHLVWIYRGRVEAITMSEFVDAKNIKFILTGQHNNWPVKDDFKVYDYSKSLLSWRRSDEVNNGTKVYSAIGGYQEGAAKRTELVIDTLRKSKRFYMLNYPIISAYNFLWNKIKKANKIYSSNMFYYGGISPTQLVLEVKDINKYVYTSKDDYFESWIRKNGISYEHEFLETDNSYDYSLMISDLDRLLGLHGRWEKRTIKCLVLIKTNNFLKPNEPASESIFSVSGPIKKIRNQELSSIVSYLNGFIGNPPIFLDSIKDERVNMDLKFSSWSDIKAIKSALQEYGFDLKEEIKELDQFILTEKNYKRSSL